MTNFITEESVERFETRRKVAALTVIPVGLFASIIPTLFFIPMILSNGMEIPLWAGLTITVAGELLAIIFLLWLAGLLKEWRLALSFTKIKWKHIGIGLGAGAAAWVALQGIGIALAAFGINLESSDTSSEIFKSEGIVLYIMLFLFVPFVAPFIEEVLFRGVIIGSLQRTESNSWALSIIVSGVTFGALHVQGFSTFTDFFVLFWIIGAGCLFAFLYLKTGSIWTSIFAHMIYNLIPAVILFLAQGAV